MARDAEWARVLLRSDVSGAVTKWTLSTAIVAVVLSCAGCRVDRSKTPRHFGLGRAATPAEIAVRNVDVGPDGAGLPSGHGSAQQGSVIYAQQCASCHGDNGEGKPPLYPALIGRDPRWENFVFGKTPGATRTIGNYWPYATTVFDYVRRAMPLTAPGSLSDDQVYAVTAYLLAANAVIPSTATLDSAALTAVRMPYVDKFVRDNRHGGHEVK
jgi:cytochrome c